MFELTGSDLYTECLNELILFGANVNKQDKDKRTPLMLATMNNQTNCLKILLEAGADPDIVNNKNETALMYYCVVVNYTEFNSPSSNP